MAEALRWKYHPAEPGGAVVNAFENPKGGYASRFPDWLNDLNAMHDAEKTLNEVDRVTYFRQLETIVDRDFDRVIAFAVGDATSSQRAEAFLRVKGLWK